MADEQAPKAEPQVAPAPGVGTQEIEDGKVFAILSYVIPLFFIVPLIQRNNEFALFHAKQVLLLSIAAIVINGALSVSCFLVFLVPIVGTLSLVLAIVGLINAIKGEFKPIPLIGKFAIDWFKGIGKA